MAINTAARLLAAGIGALVLLAGALAGGQNFGQQPSPVTPTGQSGAAVTAPANASSDSAAVAGSTARATRETLAEMLIDPPYNFDPAQMRASDFGPFFTGIATVTRTETALLTGTPYETTLTVIEGAAAGPTVFVVAGIHGDETAGYSAGNLLKDVSIAAGRLCVISPANANGVANNSRYVADRLDLNRSFPGRPNGNAAERVADAIYRQVQEAQPDLLLDLHEARMVMSDKSDYLGSSLIYSDLADMDELFFDLLFATQTGEICSEPFAWYAPGPAGSVNRTVTGQLGIPAITVETFRGYPLERRIADQLAVVQYVLDYYDML